MLTKWIKKSLEMTLGTVLTMALIPTAQAAEAAAAGCYDAVSCLQVIAQSTTGILMRVDKLPDYMQQLLAFATNVTREDDSDTSSGLQSEFGKYAQAMFKSSKLQFSTSSSQTESGSQALSLQQQILADYFNLFSGVVSAPDMSTSYQTTLLGVTPPARPSPDKPYAAPDSAYTYLRYAAGLNLTHEIPNDKAAGKESAKIIYKNFYNSASAIQTYDAFVLSKLLTDKKNNLLQPQEDLFTKLTDAKTWFAEINSESISSVLRQMLMINSQMYVLLYELLQTQKQQLAVQAMNNTLLLVINQGNEQLITKQALGLMSSP